MRKLCGVAVTALALVAIPVFSYAQGSSTAAKPQAAKSTEVAGHPVDAGVIVILPTYIVQRDSRWFAEPEAFRPERWEDERAHRLPRFAYFPFGGGPRQCIGNGFAMMEASLLLAAIAQRFRLTLVAGQRVTPTPYVTLRPEPGIRMLMARR